MRLNEKIDENDTEVSPDAERFWRQVLAPYLRRVALPRRTCDECSSTGIVIGIGVDDEPWSAPCPFCSPEEEEEPSP